MFLHLSVILFTGGGGVLSIPGGYLFRWGLCSEGVSVQGSLPRARSPSGGEGGLCPGGFCSGGLSRRRPPYGGRAGGTHPT